MGRKYIWHKTRYQISICFEPAVVRPTTPPIPVIKQTFSTVSMPNASSSSTVGSYSPEIIFKDFATQSNHSPSTSVDQFQKMTNQFICDFRQAQRQNKMYQRETDNLRRHVIDNLFCTWKNCFFLLLREVKKSSTTWKIVAYLQIYQWRNLNLMQKSITNNKIHSNNFRAKLSLLNLC